MRIVAISDQHGFLPDIPECDLLLVGGDLCPDFPYRWYSSLGSDEQKGQQHKWFLEQWMPWRQRQPAKQCFITWGNHDWVGETDTYVEDPDETTRILIDEFVEYEGLKIYMSPWSRKFHRWAFMCEESRLSELYKAIPEGLDILVSHTPPYGHCDQVSNGAEHLGSTALWAACIDKKPKVVICGHIHGGYGMSQFGMLPHLTKVYNVALLDEAYKASHEPRVLEFEGA